MSTPNKKTPRNLPAKGPGRPKGAVNKTTATAKAIIEGAADKLGGMNRLVAWAQEDPANERVFWSNMYTKLMPLQIGGDPDNPIKTEEVGAGAAKLSAFIDGIARRGND